MTLQDNFRISHCLLYDIIIVLYLSFLTPLEGYTDDLLHKNSEIAAVIHKSENPNPVYRKGSNVHVGLGWGYGIAYDPSDAENFIELNSFLMFDYADVWKHEAPDTLKFKVNVGLGVIDEREHYPLGTLGIAALRYITWEGSTHFFPFIEAGIGVIYSEYKVEGQGMQFNFNPQIGFGADFLGAEGRRFFFEVKLWHLSNGGLNSENRGSNAILFTLGTYIK